MGDEITIIQDKTYVNEQVISDNVPVTTKNKSVQFYCSQVGWTNQKMTTKVQSSYDGGRSWRDELIDYVPFWGKVDVVTCGIEYEFGFPSDGLIRLVCDVEGSIKFSTKIIVT